MLHHRKHLTPPSPPEHPGIAEVEQWVEPTRVLVLTDRNGLRRFRVEMLGSDVTAGALAVLSVLLDVVEAENPAPASSCEGLSSSVPRLELVPPAAPL